MPPSRKTVTASATACAASVAAGAGGALRSASEARTSQRRGPQTGQATGCAWKRLSSGSPYSAAQRGQSGKQAMLVVARSYGMARVMV